MNEHNYGYLQDQLRFAGFGPGLDHALHEKLKQPRDFSLVSGKEYDRDVVAAILRFKKSTESDLVFFKNYTAYLSAEGIEPRQQTFRLKGMNGIALDQAYHLLSGCPVCHVFPEREHLPVDAAWLQLDFSSRDSSGNYKVNEFKYSSDDVKQAATKLTIFPLPSSTAATSFFDDILSGKPYQGLFDHGNKLVKLFVGYDPATKQIKLYDKQGKQLTPDEMKPFMRTEGLLPKKHINHKKGLKV